MARRLTSFVRFKPGDLERDPDTRRTLNYLGPTTRIKFPDGTDINMHRDVLATMMGFKAEIDRNHPESLLVYGDFQKAEIEEYKTVYGAEFEIVKERGVKEPCPWRI